MDATTLAAMRLAEHRFADLERENRRLVAQAERRAALAAAGENGRRAPGAEAQTRTAASGLALAGPSS